MSPSRAAIARPPVVVPRPRRFGELPAAGRRISAEECRRRRRRSGFVLPTRAEVLRRVPYGFVLLERRAGEDRLRAWASAPPGRGDGARTRAAVAGQVLAQHEAHPYDDLIVFGHQRLAEQIAAAGGPRLSRQTVQRVVQEMVRAGVLMVAQPGCSKAITGTRNHVAVYAVIGPHPAFVTELDPAGQAAVAALEARLAALVGHHPVGRSDPVKVGGNGRLDLGAETPIRGLRPARRQRPELFVPRDDPADRWAAAGWLLGWLGWTLSDEQHRGLAHYLRPFFAAGWCPEAIAVALQRLPDGTWHRTVAQDDWGVRNHGALIMQRLKAWRGPDRRPVAPPASARAVRRGPQPRWLAAEQSAALPITVAAATAPPRPARAAMLAAIAAGKAAAEQRVEQRRAARRLSAALPAAVAGG